MSKKQTSNNSDIGLGTSQVLALLTNMLDLTKKKTLDLEEIGDNIFKQIVGNTKNQIKVIANTAGDSTANDLLIDALNAYDRELYSEFPLAEILIDRLLDCTELFRIAHGKTSQGNDTFYKNASLKTLSDLAFQRKPQFIRYDSYMPKKKGPNVIPYEDD
jgi:hypothetical protein